MENTKFTELMTFFHYYQCKHYPELMVQPLSYYFMAFLGEAGELANIYKKLVRHRLGIRKINQPIDEYQFKRQIIQEYSGTLKYLAILGAKLAKDLNVSEEEFMEDVMDEFYLAIAEKEEVDFERAKDIFNRLKTH